jgi:phosphoribosylamine-glycine ligase
VVKASGLAAGKGVIVAATVEEACQAVDDMLVGAVFGEAGEALCTAVDAFVLVGIMCTHQGLPGSR